MSTGSVSCGHGDVFSIRCPSAERADAAPAALLFHSQACSRHINPPVLHPQESPVCHLRIQGAFFYSETEQKESESSKLKEALFPEGVVRHHYRLPKEALGSPYLEVFRRHRDMILG